MLAIRLTLIVTFLMCLGIFPAYAEFPKAYVGSSDVQDVALSPNGSNIAILKKGYEYSGGQQTWDIIEIRDSSTQKVITTHQIDERNYHWIEWVDDDVLLVAGRQYSIKKKKVTSQEVLALIDVKTSSAKNIFTMPKVKRQSDIRLFDVIKYSKNLNKIVLSYPKKDEQTLVKIDLETGQEKKIGQGNKDTVSWFLSNDLQPVVRIDKDKYDYIQHFYSLNEEGKWRRFQTINKLENSFEGINLEPETLSYLVLARPRETNTTGLYRFDLREPSKMEKIYENASFDLSTATVTNFQNRLLYAAWWDGQLKKHWFDQTAKRLATELDGKLKPDDNWSVVETNVSGDVWLVHVISPTNPGQYAVWNGKSGTLTYIEEERPGLSSASLSQRKRIEYLAQDGLKLTGYFTPSLKNPQSADLVVIPHGGPVSQDNMDWDGWSQFLAFRGYSVFQPNFRGSGGKGRVFEEKGHLEWGKKMQSDIDDGVKYLERNSLVSARTDRAIVGASYGGYAALSEATIRPNAYQCVVSINGVTDPITFINHYDEQDPVDRYVRNIWIERIGDPSTNETQLNQISPVHNIENITAEIYIMHGTEDEVVPIEQGKLFQKAAKDAGIPIRFNALEGVEHGNWDTRTHTKVLSNIDTFLTRCFF